ncbi:hypothetical protein [Streptomyces sp. NPDC001274]
MSDNNAFLRRLNAALPKERRHAYETPQPGRHAQSERVETTPTVDDLLGLGKNAYSRTVQQHISMTHEAMWALFLDPQLVIRTYQALRTIHANLLRVVEEEKLGGNGSSTVRRRRRGFCTMTAERLREVEALLPDDYFRPGREAQEVLLSLTAAVHKHRLSVIEEGLIPEEWDTRLWRAADHAGRVLRELEASISEEADHG